MVCIAAATAEGQTHVTPRRKPKFKTIYFKSDFNQSAGDLLNHAEVLFGCPTLNQGILITLDDGPSGTTMTILETMKKANITSLFFLSTKKLKSYRDVIHKILHDGHEIGFLIPDLDHSLVSSEDLIETISLAETALEKIVPNVFPRYLRFATGAITRELSNVTSSMGYTVVLWNAATQRLDGPDSNLDVEVAKSSLAHIPKHGAILSLTEHTKITDLLFKQINDDLDKPLSEKYFNNIFMTPEACFGKQVQLE